MWTHAFQKFETKFDASTYKLDKSLPRGKKQKRDLFNERSIRWKHMTRFVGLRPKTCIYLSDDDFSDKK